MIASASEIAPCETKGDKIECPAARLEAWRDRYLDLQLREARCSVDLTEAKARVAEESKIARLTCDADIEAIRRDCVSGLFCPREEEPAALPIVRLATEAIGGAALTGAAWCVVAEGCDSRIAVGLATAGLASVVFGFVL